MKFRPAPKSASRMQSSLGCVRKRPASTGAFQAWSRSSSPSISHPDPTIPLTISKWI